MATPVLPARLARKLIGGFARERVNNWRDFQPEEGASIRSRLGTKAGWIYEASLRMERDDVDAFHYFFEETCGDGTLTFSMPDARTGEHARWRFEGQPQEAALDRDEFLLTLSLRRLG